MDGVALAARFSLRTNQLHYCGPAGAEGALRAAAARGAQLRQARRALASFEALVPYLELIASKHGRRPFDREVVEAYWVGNGLLEGFTRADFGRLLDTLVGRGLARGIARRVRGRLPEGPQPHHAFHVMAVGVGAVTGKVATSLPNMDRCRPSWGRVLLTGESVVRLERRPLVWEGGAYGLGPSEVREYVLDRSLVPRAPQDTALALHWGLPCLALSPDQERRLEQATAVAVEQASAVAGPRPLAPLARA